MQTANDTVDLYLLANRSRKTLGGTIDRYTALHVRTILCTNALALQNRTDTFPGFEITAEPALTVFIDIAFVTELS